MREIVFKDLELKNFKCHEDMSFSFIPNRFVTIVGNNGTGKTTIFSALSWALYDQTIEGMSGDDVVRKRSGKNTSVKLTWDDGEDHYEINAYRKHFKHKNNRYLFKNGNDISGTSQKETLDKITQLIMPKDIFFNCLLFSQYVKNHFLDLTPSGRNEILDSMLLLHKFDDWFKKVGKLIDKNQINIQSVEEAIKLHRTKISMLEQNLECENESLKNVCEYSRINQNERSSEIENLKQELKNLISQIIDVENIKLEILNLEKKKSSIETQLSTLENSQISEKKQLEDKKNNNILNLKQEKQSQLEKEISSDLEKIEQLKLNKNELVSSGSKTLISLEESATAARIRDKNKRESETSAVKDEIRNLEKHINSLESTIQIDQNEMEKNTQELKKLLSFLNQPVSKCYACKQELHKDSKQELENKSKDHSKEIDRITEELSTLQEEIGVDYKQLQNLKEDLDRINKKWDQSDKELELKIQTKKAEVTEEYQNKINETDFEILNLTKRINDIKEVYKSDLEKQLSYINNSFLDISKGIEDKNKERFIDLNTHISELSLEIVQKNEILSKEQLKLERKNEIKNQIDNLEKIQQSELYSVNQRIKEIEDKIQTISSQMEVENNYIIDCDKNIEILKRRELILNFWRTGYSDTGIKSILLDDSIPILNERARELCETANNLKIRFDSQTALKSGDYRNKFGIEVLQTQNLSNLKELSSGEKRMTDIIVLLCLRHLLEERQNTRMNILLLDEILDSLDPDNAFLAVSMVKKLTEDHCVLLISHTLRDYIDSDETYTF